MMGDGGTRVWSCGVCQARRGDVIGRDSGVHAALATTWYAVMDGASKLIQGCAMLVVSWCEHGVRCGLSIDSSRPGAVVRGPSSRPVRW